VHQSLLWVESLVKLYLDRYMENELFILWTSSDETTFDKMINMYARNGIKNGWWEKITIIIWGGSTQLVKNSSIVQQGIQDLISQGVFLTACQACAERVGAAEMLIDLGVEVRYWGEPLTELLKQNKKLLTI